MCLPAAEVDAEVEDTVDTPTPDDIWGTHEFEEAIIALADNLDRHIAEGLAAKEKNRVPEQVAFRASEQEEGQEEKEEEEEEKVDYKKCRDVLAAFFQKRVKEKRWTLYQRMPRQSRDQEFDALLRQLRLVSNRAYAARRWKLFRDSKGIHPPPSFETDVATLLACYRSRVGSQGQETIFAEALNKLTGYPFVISTVSPELQTEFFESLNNAAFKEQVREIVDELSVSLATGLAGATPSTISSKTLAFETFWRQDQRRKFIAYARYQVGCRSNPNKARAANLFFAEFHCFVIECWSEAIRKGHEDDLIDDVHDALVSMMVQDCQDELYYISGWLLHKLLKAPGASDLSTLERFVESMTLQFDDPQVTTDSVIRRREVAQGALKRASKKWYDFVAFLESLYAVNLTPFNARRYGGKLFSEIGDTIKRSKALHDRFAECLPALYTKTQRIVLWRTLFTFVIPLYSKLKARDILRKLRAGKKRALDDQVAHRTKVFLTSKKG